MFQVQGVMSQGSMFHGPESQSHRIPDLRVLGPKVPSHGSQVVGPTVQGHNLGLCPKSIMLLNDKSFFGCL